MAVAWVLRHAQVTSAIIGASHAAHIDDAVGALNNAAFSAEDAEHRRDPERVAGANLGTLPPSDSRIVGFALTYDAIILGAGAAGLFCAALAGQRGRRVLVLEHAERPGKKILISGGGRCNFTNLRTTATNFLSANPHFAKSALARYTPADFVALVEKHRIPYHEKTAANSSATARHRPS